MQYDRGKWLQLVIATVASEGTDAEIDHCQNPFLKLGKSIKSWSFSGIQGVLTGGPGGWANRPFNPICCTAAKFVRCSRINGKLRLLITINIEKGRSTCP